MTISTTIDGPGPASGAGALRGATHPEEELALRGNIPCECMVCDLPEGAPHGPVEWKVALWFPGPYPKEGEVAMLLCEHCKDDWVDGHWDPPFDNFLITQVVAV